VFEEIHDIYSSPDIIVLIKRRVMHAARMRENIDACKLLVRKPEGSRLLGRLRHRKDNIKDGVVDCGSD
jgi:hypothetical protein